jgi:GTP cyclohydrolase I
MESHFKDILADLGEDPRREGLEKTPHRVAKAWRELTSGYRVDVDAMINNALFTESYNEMVLVRDISFYSLCEHHMLPFFGRAHVAYLPNKKIIGLSKIPKLVEIFARRLQVQERLTLQVAETLEAKLKPRGVAVVLEARHLCMEMRGAESHLSPTTTSCMLGTFQRDARTRKEFLELIRSKPV